MPASRSAATSSTSSRSASAAARSPGSTARAGSMSGRAAPARCRGRPATGAAARSPTVTDANLLLGRLDPTYFLGGEMQLAADEARDGARRAGIADPLGYRGEAAVTRGGQGHADDREPDHVVDHQEGVDRARLRSARFRAVLLRRRRPAARHRARARAENPARRSSRPEPGNFSALGMLLADPRLDTARTLVVRLNPENLERLLVGLRRAGGGGRRPRCGASSARAPSVRARGRDALQGPASFDQDRRPRTNDDAAGLRARFDREYLRRYGHANEAAEVEIVVLHSLATLQMKRPEIARLADPPAGAGARRHGGAADLLPGGGSLRRSAGARSLCARAAASPGPDRR